MCYHLYVPMAQLVRAPCLYTALDTFQSYLLRGGRGFETR